ncbi:oxygen-dependent tRNA uridine(34) hydroxylase TrhO [Dictyobacter arantiisoli]|uniref:oxygen-dependent tRNA uridine(34) hydroxylase TrhO n=1 Tax=Dictyobacter arantiisoli TaxID=2014874 RepID=UPI00155A9D6D
MLYYKYVEVPDPQAVMLWQKSLCQVLGLKGRVIVAKEGINGTVEGTFKAVKQYVREMNSYPAFADINYKRSEGTGNAFPGLSVKLRQDIISDSVADWHVNPTELTGKYLSADELQEWYESGKKFYLVDMRNDYEHMSGHFENAILPPLENFRDLPKVLPELQKLTDAPVVTVCTGGVRCEKATGFLLKNGMQDVYQLKDGIVTYMEKYPNQHFKGKLYVFDRRVLMGIEADDPQHEIVGECVNCHKPSENYVNCSNNECNRHLICCEECVDSHPTFTCPQGCRVAV